MIRVGGDKRHASTFCRWLDAFSNFHKSSVVGVDVTRNYRQLEVHTISSCDLCSFPFHPPPHFAVANFFLIFRLSCAKYLIRLRVESVVKPTSRGVGNGKDKFPRSIGKNNCGKISPPKSFSPTNIVIRHEHVPAQRPCYMMSLFIADPIWFNYDLSLHKM